MPKKTTCDYIETETGERIAYVANHGVEPTIVFCGGFNSNMEGVKARFFERFCQQAGRSFVRFDYRGHGQSSGSIEQYTIGHWIEDACQVIDKEVAGKFIVIGSSMGVWVMCHLIKRYKDRVLASIGLAGAPDMHEKIIDSISARQHKALMDGQPIKVATPYDDEGYTFTKQFIDDGLENAILQQPFHVNGPVRLIHGDCDESVPWQRSVQLMDVLRNKDINLTLIKEADHRLSTKQDLQLLGETLLSLISKIEGKPSH